MDYHISFIPNGDQYLLVHECDQHDPEITLLSTKVVEEWAQLGSNLFKTWPVSEPSRNVVSKSKRRPMKGLDDLAMDFGKVMHEQILSKTKCTFVKRKNEAKKSGITMTLNLRFSQNDVLHNIPWELMYREVDYLDRENVEIVRKLWLPGIRYHQNLGVQGKVRILLTWAAPKCCPEIKVRDELLQIKRGLDNHQINTCVHLLEHVDKRTLNFQIQNAEICGRPYHIWLHSGHGDDQNNQFTLVLHGKGEEAELVKPSELTFLHKGTARSLRLAILNVCHGGTRNGLAAFLTSFNIPAVLAFPTVVLDSHAIQFSKNLLNHMPQIGLYAAVKQARNTLGTAIEPLAWAQPQIISRFRGIDRIWPP